MKHIVHWGKYFPPDRGGIESVTYDLATGAACEGYRVDVVCFGSVDKTTTETIDAAVKVIRTPIRIFKFSQPIGLAYLFWSVRLGRGADIVHLHAPNMMAALATLFLGTKPRLVVHWHSDVVSKGIVGRILRPLEAAMLRRADVVIATSLAYAKGSRQLGNAMNKVVVLPIGIPDVGRKSDVDSLPSTISHHVAGRKIVLTVGRLVPYKGLEVLIEAANFIDVDAVVIIVGDGPLMGTLKSQIAQNNLQGRVLLAGRLEDSELASLFRHAAVFCLASTQRSEAFGVVLLEAMAHGLPVVATNIPGSGVSWVNEDGVSGVNVEVRNARALAEACNSLISNGELRRILALGARKRYEDFFTHEKAASKLMGIYKSMMEVSPK